MNHCENSVKLKKKEICEIAKVKPFKNESESETMRHEHDEDEEF